MRPEIIPETLVHTAYWYRTVVEVPKAYKSRHVWLNSTHQLRRRGMGERRAGRHHTRSFYPRRLRHLGAGKAGAEGSHHTCLASAKPWRSSRAHTPRRCGQERGVTALDGPTFLSTIGWDWLPAIRDRDTGIWQKVFLSATGPVLVKDPLVTTDLPLPKIDSADIGVKATGREHHRSAAERRAQGHDRRHRIRAPGGACAAQLARGELRREEQSCAAHG